MRRPGIALLLFVVAAVARGQDETTTGAKVSTLKNPPDIIVGTVQSIDCASEHSDIIACTGGPINAGNPTGTVTLQFQSQDANKFFKGPNTGSAVDPVFAYLSGFDTHGGQQLRNTFRCGEWGLFFRTTAATYSCMVSFSNNTSTGAGGAVQTGTTNHWGLVSVATGTGTGGACPNCPGSAGLMAGGNTSTAVSSRTQVLLGQGVTGGYAAGRLQSALSDGTDRYIAEFALLSDVDMTITTPAEGANGVGFRYTDNQNSGKILGFTRVATAETTCDTGIAENTGFHSYMWIANAAGTNVDFYVDPTFPTPTINCSISGALGTAIPSAAMTIAPAYIYRTVGSSNSRRIELYSFAYAADFTAAR